MNWDEYAKAKGEPYPMLPLANDNYHREPMTFHIYADTGEKGGPYRSLPLAFKHARALVLGNKKTKVIELRPASSQINGGFEEDHKYSFYRLRHELL